MKNSKKILKKTVLIIVIVGLFIFSSYRPEKKPQKFTFPQNQKLGTFVDITVYTDDELMAQNAANLALYRIDKASEIMNTYDPTSELSMAVEKAKNGPTEISYDLYEILSKGVKYCELTDDAFDITLPPLLKLWKDAAKTDTLPSAEQISDIMNNQMGYEHILLTAPQGEKQATLEIDNKYLKINMNAIAKGHIADLAADEMKKIPGIYAGMINIGGEIVCFNNNNNVSLTPAANTPEPDYTTAPDVPEEYKNLPETGYQEDMPVSPDMYPEQQHIATTTFKVGIQDPFMVDSSDAAESYSWVISLTNCSVATSGNYRQYVTIEGQRYSHIVDPRTGYPANHNPSVTVIAPKCGDADALATALSVMDPEEGIELIENIHDTEAMIISGTKENNQIYRTTGFNKYMAE